MNKQVLSIKEMQELIDMGIDVSKASMCWVSSVSGIQLLVPNEENSTLSITLENEFLINQRIPAFTLQDILTLLPYRISTTYPSYLSIHPLHDGGWHIRYSRMECDEKSTGGKTLLEAAFNMFKWCKENKYI